MRLSFLITGILVWVVMGSGFASTPRAGVPKGWPVNVDTKQPRQFKVGIEAVKKRKKPALIYIHTMKLKKTNKRGRGEVQRFKAFCRYVGADAALSKWIKENFVVFVVSQASNALKNNSLTCDYSAIVLIDYAKRGPDQNYPLKLKLWEQTPKSMAEFKETLQKASALKEQAIEERISKARLYVAEAKKKRALAKEKKEGAGWLMGRGKKPVTKKEKAPVEEEEEE